MEDVSGIVSRLARKAFSLNESRTTVEIQSQLEVNWRVVQFGG